jgi:imidazolonepropionase
MTVTEALTGITQHAARALGQAHRHGLLAAGRSADFVVWDIESPAELAYWFGHNPCLCVVHAGHIVRGSYPS